MKHSVAISLVLASCGLAMTGIPSAHAQCYGDSAHSFGCGVQAGSSDELEIFGDSKSRGIMPEYDLGDPLSADNLFTDQERRQMYRRIITSGKGGNQSNAAFTQSMDSAARPNRRLGTVASRLNRRYRRGRAY